MRANAVSGLCVTTFVGFALVLSGCSSDSPFAPPPPPPPPSPDTPLSTMQMFEQVYQYQDLPKYENLITSDFRYLFSQASDPDLVLAYGSNWGKDDEVVSAKHLFEGFTNSIGDPVAGASRIDMELTGVQFTADLEHQDSTAHYQKVIVSRVTMSIEVPGSPEPTLYNIDARHEYYLVRGDAAVLDAGQEARADRWYIRRWDDLSPPNPSPAMVPTGPTAYSTTSWGSLRARYRR